MTNGTGNVLEKIRELSMADLDQLPVPQATKPDVARDAAPIPSQDDGLSSLAVASMVLGGVALVVAAVVFAIWSFEGDKRVTAVKHRPSSNPAPPPAALPSPPAAQAVIAADSGFVSPKYTKYGKASSGAKVATGSRATDLNRDCVVAATTDIRQALQGCLDQHNPIPALQ